MTTGFGWSEGVYTRCEFLDITTTKALVPVPVGHWFILARTPGVMRMECEDDMEGKRSIPRDRYDT